MFLRGKGKRGGGGDLHVGSGCRRVAALRRGFPYVTRSGHSFGSRTCRGSKKDLLEWRPWDRIGIAVGPLWRDGSESVGFGRMRTWFRGQGDEVCTVVDRLEPLQRCSVQVVS